MLPSLVLLSVHTGPSILMLQTRQCDPDGRHRRLETTLDGRVDADQDGPTPPQFPLQNHVQKLDVRSVGASPGERGTFGRGKYRIVRIATPNTNGLWNVECGMCGMLNMHRVDTFQHK